MSTAYERRILAIDDNQSIHEDYRKVLQSNIGSREQNELDSVEALLFGESPTVPDGPSLQTIPFQIDSAFQGQEGLEMVKQSIAEARPYSVAFIDVRMPPGWNGVETTRRIWEIDPNLPVVLCTAYTDFTWEQIAGELVHSEQLLILKKPFDNLELRQLAHAQSERRRLGTLAALKHDELERMVDQRTQQMKKTRELVFFSLARLADSRDECTGKHIERIQAYCQLLGDSLVEKGPYQSQITQKLARQIARSSILHDIGKVGIPDSILLKPSRLTPDEFVVMKRHVSIGADALDEAASYADCCGFLELAAEIARYHHERFDGSGYLLGINGTDIPLSSRIVAVADVFDALTMDRVYKKAISPADARDMILLESGKHFDPAVVSAFEDKWEAFNVLASRSHGSEGSQSTARPNLAQQPYSF